jgi:hypothetical protein
MKILLVSPELSDFKKLESNIASAGRSDVLLFHYVHPLKAIDNIEEILPDVIIWSIIDFPRHWKTLIPFASGIPALDGLIMVLFANHTIEEKEADKARALQVTDIIQQGLGSPEAEDVIRAVLQRFPAPEISASSDSEGHTVSASGAQSPSLSSGSGTMDFSQYRFVAENPSTISLIMTHPLSLKLIRGTVHAVDPDSIEFSPEKDRDLSDLPVGTLLKGSRVKIGDYRLQLDLKLQKLDSGYDLVVQNPEREYLPVLNQLIHGKII